MGARIRVVLADDHQMFRKTVALLLGTQADMEIVGQGASADDAVRLAQDLSPDIILLDVGMPGGGLNAARIIGTTYPQIKVAVLTGHQEEDYAVEAINAGASAYIVKGTPARDLIEILRAITVGHTYVAPGLIAA